LVEWWHDETKAPSFTELFEYLLDEAEVWRRPLRSGDESDEEVEEEVEEAFAATPLEWRVIAPAPVMFTQADPYFNPLKRPRDEADDEDEDEKKQKTKDDQECEVCHRAPRAPQSRICAGCSLQFATQNKTPPGFVRNRARVLRPVCSICHEKPARKNGTKCESCCYKLSSRACGTCRVTGVKISKGLCPACIKRAPTTQSRQGEDTSKT
jgi:hypothetical protein